MNTVPRDPKDNVSLSHGRRGPTSTWDILDLLEKCFPVDAIECSPPAIEPPPPSGLVPFVPSFECIERDVMYINGCVYRIGASPEGPAQGAVHTASVIYAISPSSALQSAVATGHHLHSHRCHHPPHRHRR